MPEPKRIWRKNGLFRKKSAEVGISDLYWERVSFPQLATLDLRDNPLSLDEMFEILEATGLPQLKRLVANTPEGFTRGELDKRLVIDDTRPPWA